MKKWKSILGIKMFTLIGDIYIFGTHWNLLFVLHIEEIFLLMWINQNQNKTLYLRNFFFLRFIILIFYCVYQMLAFFLFCGPLFTLLRHLDNRVLHRSKNLSPKTQKDLEMYHLEPNWTHLLFEHWDWAHAESRICWTQIQPGGTDCTDSTADCY